MKILKIATMIGIGLAVLTSTAYAGETEYKWRTVAYEILSIRHDPANPKVTKHYNYLNYYLAYGPEDSTKLKTEAYAIRGPRALEFGMIVYGSVDKANAFSNIPEVQTFEWQQVIRSPYFTNEDMKKLQEFATTLPAERFPFKYGIVAYYPGLDRMEVWFHHLFHDMEFVFDAYANLFNGEVD